MYYLLKVVDLPASGLVRTAGNSALITAVAMVAPLFMYGAGSRLDPLTNVALGSVGLGLGWLIGVFALDHPISGEIRIVVRNLVPATR